MTKLQIELQNYANRRQKLLDLKAKLTALQKQASKRIGQEVRKSRIERRMNQGNLSKEIGIHHTFLSVIETGYTPMNDSTLIKLVKWANKQQSK